MIFSWQNDNLVLRIASTKNSFKLLTFAVGIQLNSHIFVCVCTYIEII